jgi:hypothetical protein
MISRTQTKWSYQPQRTPDLGLYKFFFYLQVVVISNLTHFALPIKCMNNGSVTWLFKLSLCFNWAPHHEGVLGEWRYSSTHSLTSALDGGEWSGSCPGRFTPRERVPGIHWIGGWVGPRTVQDVVVKRIIPSTRRESNPRAPIDSTCI